MFKAITLNDANASDDVLTSMFALRHDVFINRLGWDLNGEGGAERDQFDDENAVYLVLQNDAGDVCASARMLPTTSPCILGNVFPELVDGPPPSSPWKWEVTRVAVDHRPDRLALAPLANVSGSLWCCLMEFALAMNLEALVSVSDVRLERILKRVGWDMRRLGPEICMDNVGVVGETFSVNSTVLQTLRRKCRVNGPVLDLTTLPVHNLQEAA